MTTVLKEEKNLDRHVERVRCDDRGRNWSDAAGSQKAQDCCCCCCCVTSVVSDSVRPHRRQPTRLPRPWDSPGKNTGVCCYFLLQCMKVKSESEVTQSCPTLSDPVDCSLRSWQRHKKSWKWLVYSIIIYFEPWELIIFSYMWKSVSDASKQRYH